MVNNVSMSVFERNVHHKSDTRRDDYENYSAVYRNLTAIKLTVIK